MVPTKVHEASGRPAPAAPVAGRRSTLGDGTEAHPITISGREMESLTAICDTFLPSLAVNSDVGDEALAEFYGTSASMCGAPEMIGGLLSGGLKHPALGLLRIALWFLSTWYGTFVMCGLPSLSNKFPLFHKFASLELSKRQEILLSWSLSSIHLLRMLFQCLKFLSMRIYFAKINERQENPCWKAIGYCGPDPTFHDDERTSHKQGDDDEEDEWSGGPLRPALLDMDSTMETISNKLHQAGFPSPSPSHLTIHCDAVIVGSGSGGSVVASVLARAGHKVIVLEKGHYYHSYDLSLLEGPTNSQMYEGGGLIATDDVGVLLLAGSTVGGGSTVNWSASVKTPTHVTKEWCDELGLELFGSETYQRALDVVCDRMGVQSCVDEEGFNNAVLRKGCEKLGIPVSNVPCNAPPDHYCGWCHLGCKDAKKQGAQETWLVDVAESGNGIILPGCRVSKVLHRKKEGSDRTEAIGVLAESLRGGQAFVVRSKVTVVACGAINTPVLLKKSGLKNKNIGKNLHLHPCVMAWGYFPAESGGWPEETKRSYEGGILTAMSTDAVADSNGYGIMLQTPALHPANFSTLTPWVSAGDFRERMRRFSRTAHVFALARDRGSGTSDYPRSLSYHLDGADEDMLRKGLEAILRILKAAGAEEVGTQHHEGDRLKLKKGAGGEEELEEFLRKQVRRKRLGDLTTPISSAHQMGSCRMGTDPRVSAVKPSGETWEVGGLFVADTSVFPTALGVNPMVTCMAIAHCTARSVLDVLGCTARARQEEEEEEEGGGMLLHLKKIKL